MAPLVSLPVNLFDYTGHGDPLMSPGAPARNSRAARPASLLADEADGLIARANAAWNASRTARRQASARSGRSCRSSEIRAGISSRARVPSQRAPRPGADSPRESRPVRIRRGKRAIASGPGSGRGLGSGLDLPLGDQAVGRDAGVEGVGPLAVHVRRRSGGRGAQPVEIEVGVAGLERIEGPGDEVQPLGAGEVALDELEPITQPRDW